MNFFILFSFDEKKFEEYVVKTSKELKIPGLAVGIIVDGKIYKITHGSKCVNKSGENIDSQTLFNLSSVTKTVTATLMAILVDKGLISFDDPVVKYLPDFHIIDDQTSKSLKLRDLLGHRVGLNHYSGDSLLKLGHGKKKIFEAIAKLPKKGIPGKDYGYQNHFYGLMKDIIEKVTGKSFDVVAEEFLFKPLHMHSTHYIEKPSWSFLPKGCTRESQNFAYPHYTESKCEKVTSQFLVFPTSMGLQSNLDDMIKWLQFSMSGGDKVLSRKNFDEIHKVGTRHRVKDSDVYFQRTPEIGYCMGWFSYDYGEGDKKVHVYSHQGAWMGYRTGICYMPEFKAGIVILSNYGSIEVNLMPECLRSQFVDMLLQIPDCNWCKRLADENKKNHDSYIESLESMKYQNPQPHDKLDLFVGAYDNLIYGSAHMVLKENALFLTYNGRTAKLKHLNGNRFTFDATELDPDFSPQTIAFVDVGFDPKGRTAFACNLMYEGEDTLFLKK